MAAGRAAERAGLIEHLKEDLAARLQVPAAAIAVVEEASVTWPDAGLGCAATRGTLEPSPVPGFRITLGCRGELFRYHADRGGRFIRCPDPRKPLAPLQ